MNTETDELKTIKKLLTEDRAIAFRSTLKQITGSYCAALMLAQLMFWYPKASNEWMYKTDAEMGEEICASSDELQTARARLTKLGFVETKRIGIPAKMHYRVNFEAIINAISPSGDGENQPENASPVSENPRNLLPTTPDTSFGGHSDTSFGEPPELSYTEMTTEMTTSDGADAQAHPSGKETQKNRHDGMDTELAFERLRAAGRAAGRDKALAAHRLAGRWPHLVGHCVAFEQASGLAIGDVPQSKVSLWVKALEGHVGAGLRPEDEKTLVNMARSRKFSVYSPGSLDNLIAVMRQGAAATEQPRYKTLVS